MDYRKDTRTPRDRVDDELLSRLLMETDELLTDDCGCESGDHSHRSVRSVRRDVSNGGRSCGCERNRVGRRAEERSGNSCGCERNRTDRNDGRIGSPCGCERSRTDRNDDRSGSSCGCERNRTDRNDDRSGSSCGCERSRTDRNDDRSGSSCGCIDRTSMSIQTQGLPLVMSYAPDHEFHLLYEDEEALMNGTLFRELNLPFYPGKCGSSCGCE